MPSDPITFAAGALDRAASHRDDTAWLEAARADERARAVVAGRRGVLLEGAAPARVALDDRESFLLGIEADGAPLFAVEAAEEELTDLRLAAMTMLADADAGLLAYAHALLHWHRTHRFCGLCGTPTTPGEAGFVRTCENGHPVHPRTDPVVIMLVVDGDRVLLGRQPSWPERRYSALAGFVEPGEPLEAAVAREVSEEAGVEVGAVRYVASQPWPFPASLMIGFEADYAGGDIATEEDELEDARWFSRAEVAAAVDGDETGPFVAPPRLAIARRLLEHWLAT